MFWTRDTLTGPPSAKDEGGAIEGPRWDIGGRDGLGLVMALVLWACGGAGMLAADDRPGTDCVDCCEPAG